jgi:preprotein translocase subunit YajC
METDGKMRKYFLTVLVLVLALSPVVLGQTGQGSGSTPQPGPDFKSMIIMFAVIFGIFYILVINPQKKQQKKHQERVNTLKAGDRVLTAGGMFAICRDRDDKKGKVTLEIAKGVQIEVTKNSIATILSPEGEEVSSDPARTRK